jgi:hypothetical protein
MAARQLGILNFFKQSTNRSTSPVNDHGNVEDAESNLDLDHENALEQVVEFDSGLLAVPVMMMMGM